MYTTQTLPTINDMQVNVQQGLPVLPNNGNPAGAYNMPQQAGGMAQPAPAPDPYAWLQPSPAMTMLMKRLEANGQRLQQMHAPVQPAVVPPMQTPQPMGMPQPMQAPPVMPQIAHTVPQQVAPVLPVGIKRF